MEKKEKVFEYVVVWYPTEEEKKDGKRPKVIIPQSSILATDQGTATLQIARQIPKEYEDKLDQLDIAIRPF